MRALTQVIVAQELNGTDAVSQAVPFKQSPARSSLRSVAVPRPGCREFRRRDSGSRFSVPCRSRRAALFTCGGGIVRGGRPTRILPIGPSPSGGHLLVASSGPCVRIPPPGFDSQACFPGPVKVPGGGNQEFALQMALRVGVAPFLRHIPIRKAGKGRPAVRGDVVPHEGILVGMPMMGGDIVP